MGYLQGGSSHSAGIQSIVQSGIIVIYKEKKDC
jgi:hypothetical protein